MLKSIPNLTASFQSIFCAFNAELHEECQPGSPERHCDMTVVKVEGSISNLWTKMLSHFNLP